MPIDDVIFHKYRSLNFSLDQNQANLETQIQVRQITRKEKKVFFKNRKIGSV